MSMEHPVTTVSGSGDNGGQLEQRAEDLQRRGRTGAVSATVGSSAMEVQETAVAGAPATAVAGEVDMATAPALTGRLEEAVRRTDGLFVVDLCAVTFFDSSGVHALLRTSALLGRGDRPLMIVCPPGHVRRVLELTGIIDMFALYDSHEHAIRALAPDEE